MDPGYGHNGQLRAAVTALGQGAPRRTRPGLGQGGGVGLAEQGLAPDQVAGRFRRLAVVALCAPARARRPLSPPDDCPQEWLLIEWPEDETEPTKYWLSTLPERISFRRLVDLAKLRWRIERDYQDLKQEVGLGHYEGRGWRGFHHHATLCIAAYGFLIAEQATIPPSGPRSAAPVQVPPLPDNYRPRGSALAA